MKKKKNIQRRGYKQEYKKEGVMNFSFLVQPALSSCGNIYDLCIGPCHLIVVSLQTSFPMLRLLRRRSHTNIGTTSHTVLFCFAVSQ